MSVKIIKVGTESVNNTFRINLTNPSIECLNPSNLIINGLSPITTFGYGIPLNSLHIKDSNSAGSLYELWSSVKTKNYVDILKTTIACPTTHTLTAVGDIVNQTENNWVLRRNSTDHSQHLFLQAHNGSINFSVYGEASEPLSPSNHDKEIINFGGAEYPLKSFNVYSDLFSITGDSEFDGNMKTSGDLTIYGDDIIDAGGQIVPGTTTSGSLSDRSSAGHTIKIYNKDAVVGDERGMAILEIKGRNNTHNENLSIQNPAGTNIKSLRVKSDDTFIDGDLTIKDGKSLFLDDGKAHPISKIIVDGELNDDSDSSIFSAKWFKNNTKRPLMWLRFNDIVKDTVEGSSWTNREIVYVTKPYIAPTEGTPLPLMNPITIGQEFDGFNTLIGNYSNTTELQISLEKDCLNFHRKGYYRIKMTLSTKYAGDVILGFSESNVIDPNSYMTNSQGNHLKTPWILPVMEFLPRATNIIATNSATSLEMDGVFQKSTTGVSEVYLYAISQMAEYDSGAPNAFEGKKYGTILDVQVTFIGEL